MTCFVHQTWHYSLIRKLTLFGRVAYTTIALGTKPSSKPLELSSSLLPHLNPREISHSYTSEPS